MQFDSVEEVARQVNLPKKEVRPLPLQKWQQDKCFVNGELERDDLELANDAYDRVEDARLGRKQAWEVDPVQGPRRARPLVPIQPAREMDPHEYIGRDA